MPDRDIEPDAIDPDDIEPDDIEPEVEGDIAPPFDIAPEEVCAKTALVKDNDVTVRVSARVRSFSVVVFIGGLLSRPRESRGTRPDLNSWRAELFSTERNWCSCDGWRLRSRS